MKTAIMVAIGIFLYVGVIIYICDKIAKLR